MRCYNGCPDSELQALIDECNTAVKEARQQGVEVTFFPAESAWMAFRQYEPVSGFHDTPRQAMQEALA